jgi:phage shock protein A
LELEEDLKTIDTTVSDHKLQLQSLLRDLEQIKQEKHETVAEIITAKEEREIADMVSGISQDRTSEELQELRDIRDEAKATARISREMSGLDTKRSEEEFLEFAAKSAADSEFDALIGLAQEAETPRKEEPDKTRLPES